MENIKKETGFKGKKVYEEVEKYPEKELKSPPISQVKLMKMKYENINSMKRLSKGGPMGIPKSDQKASHNEGTSQKLSIKVQGVEVRRSWTSKMLTPINQNWVIFGRVGQSLKRRELEEFNLKYVLSTKLPYRREKIS